MQIENNVWETFFSLPVSLPLMSAGSEMMAVFLDLVLEPILSWTHILKANISDDIITDKGFAETCC